MSRFIRVCYEIKRIREGEICISIDSLAPPLPRGNLLGRFYSQCGIPLQGTDRSRFDDF